MYVFANKYLADTDEHLKCLNNNVNEEAEKCNKIDVSDVSYVIFYIHGSSLKHLQMNNVKKNPD